MAQMLTATGELAERAGRMYEEARASGRIATRSGGSRAIAPTGLSPGGCEALRRIAREHAPHRMLETGFAYGLSALSLLRGALESGAGEPKHTAIDPFAESSWGGAGTLLLERAGLGPHLRVLIEDSASALPSLERDGERFDLAFIDGGHRFEEVFIDLFYALRLVIPDAPVIVDDLWMPAVRCAVDYFTSNIGARIELRDKPGDRSGLAILRLGGARRQRAWDDFVAFGTMPEGPRAA